MANSSLIKELISQIYNIQSQSCEILKEISNARSQVTFPLSPSRNFISSHFNDTLEIIPTAQSYDSSKQTFKYQEEEEQPNKSSKVMSQKIMDNHPLCLVSSQSDKSNKDMESILLQNNYLRKKVGRMQTKIDKYKQIIATLTNLINTQ